MAPPLRTSSLRWPAEEATDPPTSSERLRQRLYEQLVAREWPRFHGYALHLCDGNGDDAEDLLSETMIDAYRSFDAYRGTGFDRWFFRMLQTNRIDMIRRARVRRSLSLDTGSVVGEPFVSLEMADPAPGPEGAIDGLLSESMERALAALPESQRLPLWLSDVDEHEYEEIATLMGLPLGTVKSRIHRARARMRQFLEQHGWGGA